MKTSWDPAVSGGVNVGTHNLKLVSPERMVFSTSMAARLVIGILFAVPLVAIICIPIFWDDLDLPGALGIFIFGGGISGVRYLFRPQDLWAAQF